MASLKIKYLKGAFTVFALCLIGTVSAAPNGNGDEKEDKKEVKAKSETTIIQTEAWEFNGTPGNLNEETNASYYSRPSSTPNCSGGANICIVVAPEDPSNPGQPLLSPELQERIEHRETDSGDVMLKN